MNLAATHRFRAAGETGAHLARAAGFLVAGLRRLRPCGVAAAQHSAALRRRHGHRLFPRSRRRPAAARRILAHPGDGHDHARLFRGRAGDRDFARADHRRTGGRLRPASSGLCSGACRIASTRSGRRSRPHFRRTISSSCALPPATMPAPWPDGREPSPRIWWADRSPSPTPYRWFSSRRSLPSTCCATGIASPPW